MEKNNKMLLNTENIPEYIKLREMFYQWYGDDPEITVMNVGQLRGDILLPVTIETFARLYKEKILTPETNDGTIISPDELAFHERLKFIGYNNRAEVERALKELENEEEDDYAAD